MKETGSFTIVESPDFGRVAVCEIGATMVGSILQTHVPNRAVKKGEEKGLFKFGGSCVVTIFQAGKIKIDDDLLKPAAEGMEVYARMGDRLTYIGGLPTATQEDDQQTWELRRGLR